MMRPILVIMAAGMGSRYGGLKQIDPIDGQGHIIMDFSIFDAVAAGFREVVFIIKRENEGDFRTAVGDRLSRFVKVHYAYQELDDLPAGYALPEGRVKPWGTGHAVLSGRNALQGTPFAVINADDYYGRDAFRLVFDYLTNSSDNGKYHYAMVGYQLGNTLTEHGCVARGVCHSDEAGFLSNICEYTRIQKRGDGAVFTRDEGATWHEIDVKTTVSMNLWGFTESFLFELQSRFPAFLDENLRFNPKKTEYFLPFVVNELLKENKADVRVLPTKDKWYGVTYKEDKPVVMYAIRCMKEEGMYPRDLWK